MANKKNSKKNNKNLKTKQTKKEQPKKEQQKVKFDIKGSSDSNEIGNVFKYLIIVLLIFVGVYFLTDYITNHSSNSDYKNKVSEATIQSDKILAGSTFNQKDEEYYVLFYNTTDDATYTDTYSSYKEKEGHLPIYYVDTKEGLNRDYVGEEANEEPTSIEDLKVSGPTLIKIVNKEVEEYITDSEEITKTLS